MCRSQAICPVCWLRSIFWEREQRLALCRRTLRLWPPLWLPIWPERFLTIIKWSSSKYWQDLNSSVSRSSCSSRMVPTIMCSGWKRVTAVWQAPMPEIKMRSWLWCVCVRWQHGARNRVRLCGIRWSHSMRNTVILKRVSIPLPWRVSTVRRKLKSWWTSFVRIRRRTSGIWR